MGARLALVVVALVVAALVSPGLAGAAPACTIVGTAGPDRLVGTPGRDVICGGGGNDTIYGLGGNDELYGGRGHDTIRGGPGHDTIAGGPGNDELYGGRGHDDIGGRRGNDQLYGLGGNDLLRGGKGKDWLDGGNGDDLLFGGPGDDRLDGDSGNDRLYGDHDIDLLPRGGRGNDQLYGRSGDDLLVGGPGDDLLDGGSGNDQLYGERGNDELYGGPGDDQLDGGPGTDELDGWLEQSTPPPAAAFEPRGIYNQRSHVYSPGRAIVHYVSAGADAPSLADSDRDGTPDYVERIAEAAELSLDRFASLGFRPPSPDHTGPDARVDIYIKDIDGDGDWAAEAFSFARRDGGYAIVEPDLRGLAATVAHELFHLVQFAYLPRGFPACWAAEGTASAAESMVYPARDRSDRDEDWLEQPWLPLAQATLGDTYEESSFCYAGQAWFEFLHERDPGLLPAYFELLAGSHGLKTVSLLDTATRQRGLGPAGRLYAQFAAAMWNHGHTVYTWATVHPAGPAVTTDYWVVHPLAAHYISVESAYECRVGLRVEGDPVEALLVVDGRLATPAETADGEVTFIEDICSSGGVPSSNVMLIVTSDTNAGPLPAYYQVFHGSG